MKKSPFKAKKTLGQHFLTSTKALADICDASQLGPDDIILEIGPGQGVLTEVLLAATGKVIAVEKDRELVAYLKEKFSKEIQTEKLEILEKDILDFDPATIVSHTQGQKKEYKLVANIPYYITGEIIRKFLEADCRPTLMTLLVQKEVADRIVSKGGKESILSLSVRFFGQPQYVSTVKRGSFRPAPNVDSAIITIDGIHSSSRESERQFFRLIKAGFKSKRKKLSSNLTDIASREKIESVFSELKLDPNIRAEDVSFSNWQELAYRLTTAKK